MGGSKPVDGPDPVKIGLTRFMVDAIVDAELRAEL